MFRLDLKWAHAQIALLKDARASDPALAWFDFE